MHKYSHIASNFINLLIGIENGKKTRPFHFIKKAKKSFKSLKAAFIITLILIYFNPAKKIKIEINALKFAIASSIS